MENDNCAPPLSFLSATKPGSCLSELIFNRSECGNTFTSQEKRRARQAFESASGLRIDSIVGTSRTWDISRTWFLLLSWGLIIPSLVLIGLVLLLLTFSMYIHPRLAALLYLITALVVYTGIILVRAGAAFLFQEKITEIRNDISERRNNITDSLPKLVHGILAMACAVSSDGDSWTCGNIKPTSENIGGPL